MKVIGLTGPSGSGKSTVAKLLGFPVVDADIVAREVMRPSEPCLKECAAAFGEDIVLPDGTLDRAKLASRAFSSPDKTELLNSITFPHINARIEKKIKMLGESVVILDAPQLFESGCNEMCDFIVGVLASEDIRLSRILSRDNITESTAKKRMSAGLSSEFFKAHCDRIIWNNGDLDELSESLQKLKEDITAL